MKKTIYSFCVLFFAIMTTFSSCKKYLDLKADPRLKTPTTIEDLQGLLDDAYTMNLSLTPCLGETSADDYFLQPDVFSQQPTIEQGFYTWQPTAYNFPNDWSRSYAAVFNANFCIEALPSYPQTKENIEVWNNVKGAAHFYRAFNYLNLLWTYAKAYDEEKSSSDLGIVLRSGSDFNEKSTRATVEECYNQVINDLHVAVSYLPSTGIHVYRPSKSSSYGLLSRAYWSMRKYDSAYFYADAALKLKSKLLDFNDLPISSSNPFPEFNDEIIFYSEMYLSLTNLGRGRVDTILFKSYLPGDLRALAYYRPRAQYQAIKKNYATAGVFTGIATDELMLIRAECSARAGNVELALADLNNLLRKRYDSRFVPLEITNPLEVLETILNERRKELAFRGLRWIDIKRLNMESKKIALKRSLAEKIYSLEPNANYYALPLPADIINVTGIPQN